MYRSIVGEWSAIAFKYKFTAGLAEALKLSVMNL
jgi:hypothetical protein